MDKNEILKSAPYFSEIAFHYLSACMNEYERKSPISFVIAASIFSEALLKDIYRILSFEHIDGELNSLINNLKCEVRKKTDLSHTDRTTLVNIGGRCDEIRLKRNRLVHATGIPDKELDTEVADVHKNILFIVEKYLTTTVAAVIFTSKNTQATGSVEHTTNPNFKAFISTITPHTVEQTVFLNAIDDELRKLQIEPVRCQFDDYDRKDPIEKVRATIEKCDAFLVIGLERSHSYMYRDREFSEKQKDGLHRKHTSGWLHLESGLAASMKKPIFVLCQNDIYSDGIFDRDWNSYTVLEIPTPLNATSEKVQFALLKIREYADKHTR